MLLLLVRTRFQVLFHSPHRGSFRLSLTVLVHYRSVSSILALEDGPPIFRQDITCPALLDFTDDEMSTTGLSPCIAALSRAFVCLIKSLRANPISLAATFGISVDFSSSGYLDVSVPRVRLAALCIHAAILTYVSGFPHSEIPDSKTFTV